MGIQLDWQIESEQQQRRAVEDPSIRRQRRRQWRFIFTTILVVACLVGSVGAVIYWRLQEYDNQLQESLLNTVDAEIRALRVGDEDAYMSIRRSSDTYWLGRQSEVFAEYQQLKIEGQLELTGNVVDIEIDQNPERQRARVLVEEIIGGEPFLVAWFYWYYESDPSGWRRLTPDTEFWGEAQTLDNENVQVEYAELDAPLAEAIFDRVGAWWADGCVVLSCNAAMPSLTVEISPRPAASPEWNLSDDWMISVASPLYDGRMSRNSPLTPLLEYQLAGLISNRFIEYNLSPSANLDASLSSRQTTAYADAQWLYGEYQQWMLGYFTGIGESGFLSSLADVYGDITPPRLLQLLSADSQLGDQLEAAIGLSVTSMSQDTLNQIEWRGYFAARLNFEADILRDAFSLGDEQQRIVRHYELYDGADANAIAIADTNRVSFDPQRPDYAVTNVTILIDAFGRPQAMVEAISYPEQPPQIIVFAWVDQTWKRIG